jgi:hypothetical protein
VAGDVGAADRVGLAQEVVGEADLGVGVGAADLLQGAASACPDLVGAEAEQRGDVVVALAALEQQLKHRPLVAGEWHGPGSLRTIRDAPR